MTVLLLCAFAIRVDGETLSLPTNAQRLLTFLALHDRPVPRSHVAGTLWAESPEERASANLRSALWRLRQPGVTLAETVGTALRLADEVRVDLHRAVLAARRLLDPADPWCPSLAEAVDLGLTKDILPACYDDWAVVEREAYRQLRFHALEALCRRLRAHGRYAEAVEAGVRAVECEPLGETAHQALICAHLAEGNAPEALRQYERYRRMLVNGFGLEPSREIKEIVRKLYTMRGVSGRTRSANRPAPAP